jgi:hypothetical protein
MGSTGSPRARRSRLTFRDLEHTPHIQFLDANVVPCMVYPYCKSQVQFTPYFVYIDYRTLWDMYRMSFPL